MKALGAFVVVNSIYLPLTFVVILSFSTPSALRGSKLSNECTREGVGGNCPSSNFRRHAKHLEMLRSELWGAFENLVKVSNRGSY